MKIDFRSKGFFYGDVARDYAIHRLGFALGRFSDAIKQVDVFIEDTNGSRRGADKQCTIKVFLNRVAAPVMNTVNHSSIHASIDMTAERVARSVSRTLDRRNQKRIAMPRKAMS